ncbi:AlpA family phage regulatory protein [Malikia spinosa]|uniref:AlpA family phage regulatory protein n=2 Tax=Malikia spinosa TaxID=86180 RepID=A0A7C9IWA4_9BURK|nr:AlpA family phage regulatory protein [Malikia spinosa]
MLISNSVKTLVDVISGSSISADGGGRPVVCTMSNLVKIICISRSMVYEKINPRSRYHDPRFPKPFAMEGRRKYWILSEVHSYIAEMAAKRKAGGEK